MFWDSVGHRLLTTMYCPNARMLAIIQVVPCLQEALFSACSMVGVGRVSGVVSVVEVGSAAAVDGGGPDEQAH